MSNLLKHVALVSQSARVSNEAVMAVAAALQKQATRDLGPIWGLTATLDAFPALSAVPADYWPIIIRDDIHSRAAGVHQDRNGQPFALVAAADNRDMWSLTCSHEMCEMLVDPFGRHLVAGDSVMEGQGRVNYLVEVCDPCEGARYAYPVNGILVSDFYTPRFFDPVATAATRYSFSGKLTAPRTIVEEGYLSWEDPTTGQWWQQFWRRGAAAPQFRNLGRLSGMGSLRSQVDRSTSELTAEAIEGGRGRTEGLQVLASSVFAEAGAARASALSDQIGALVAEA